MSLFNWTMCDSTTENFELNLLMDFEFESFHYLLKSISDSQLLHLVHEEWIDIAMAMIAIRVPEDFLFSKD